MTYKTLPIIFLFGLLATISAFEATPSKTLMFFDPFGNTATALIRTKHGSISYSGETAAKKSGLTPQYTLIGYNPANVTRILTDIVAACDQGISYFSKLHYHQQSSSLVYFCNSNKSLLILDEDNFTVKKSIAVKVDKSTFSTEVKMVSDGDSVVIILINGIFKTSPQPSQYVRINLSKNTLTESVLLDKHLSNGEIIVGFATDGTNDYLISNIFNDQQIKVAIYSIAFTQADYVLLRLNEFTISGGLKNSRLITQIFCLGSFVVTNNAKEIIFLNSDGKVVQKINNLDFTYLPFSGSDEYALEPMLVKGKEDALYANLKIAPGHFDILKITVTGQNITSKVISTSINQIHVAIGNKLQNDLIFRLDALNPQGNILEVFEPETSKVLYSMSNIYQGIFTTKTTYTILHFNVLTIYKLSDDSLVKNLFVFIGANINPNYYHDIEQGFFYYLSYPQTPNQCDLIKVNLVNGDLQKLSSFNDGNICNGGKIIQVNSTTSEAVIQAKDNSFKILSNKYGQVSFTYKVWFAAGIINVNFETLTVSLVFNELYVGWVLASYNYDSKTNNFTVATYSELKNIEFYRQPTFYNVGATKIYAMGYGVISSKFAVIDLITETAQVFDSPLSDPIPTKIVDNGKTDSVILSQDTSKGLAQVPYLLTSNGIGKLDGSNEFSIGAKASGPCSYYVADGLITSFKYVRIYNTCSKMEEISI